MPEKTTLAFLVVKTKAGWIVQADDFVYPLCRCFTDAVASATREAQAAGLLGFASVVLTQPVPGGPYEVHWLYGQDACPPAALEDRRPYGPGPTPLPPPRHPKWQKPLNLSGIRDAERERTMVAKPNPF